MRDASRFIGTHEARHDCHFQYLHGNRGKSSADLTLRQPLADYPNAIHFRHCAPARSWPWSRGLWRVGSHGLGQSGGDLVRDLSGVRQPVSTARSAAWIIHTRGDRYSARWSRRQACASAEP
jgi:hypothetical protein